MFPWVYGFSWNAGTVIFLGFFFSVVAVMATTVAGAALRAHRDRNNRDEDRIRWHEDFHDLPLYARTCRHVFTGEFQERSCERQFDCRACTKHQELSRLDARADGPLTQAVPSVEILGLRFPLHRKYHRGHTWVEETGDGESVLVGLDDFALRLISGEGLEPALPEPGTDVRVNGTALRFKNESGSEVRVLSPVSGTVVETQNLPSGWLLKVKVAEGGLDMKHLLGGREVRPWAVHELDRLQRILGRQSGTGIGLTLADGGELMPGELLRMREPDADWDAVAGEMLLEP